MGIELVFDDSSSHQGNDSIPGDDNETANNGKLGIVRDKSDEKDGPSFEKDTRDLDVVRPFKRLPRSTLVSALDKWRTSAEKVPALASRSGSAQLEDYAEQTNVSLQARFLPTRNGSLADKPHSYQPQTELEQMRLSQEPRQSQEPESYSNMKEPSAGDHRGTSWWAYKHQQQHDDITHTEDTSNTLDYEDYLERHHPKVYPSSFSRQDRPTSSWDISNRQSGQQRWDAGFKQPQAHRTTFTDAPRPKSTTIAYPDLSRVTEEDGPSGGSLEPPVSRQTSVLATDTKGAATSKYQERRDAGRLAESPAAQKQGVLLGQQQSHSEIGTQNVDDHDISAAHLKQSHGESSVEVLSSLRHQEVDHASEPLEEKQTSATSTQRPTYQPSEKQLEQATVELQQALARAARARQIFVGSKYFNLWADKTARRVEREAVARRHMVRFRCFQSWIQAPSLQMPVAEQLKATTAAQKLRRAIEEQDKQLRETVALLVERYKLKLVIKVLDRWARHGQADLARQSLARRTRAKTLDQWFIKASNKKALEDALLMEELKTQESKALQNWQVAAEKGATRRHAAAQIGHAHIGLGYLKGWWDQAELQRRGKLYRDATLKDKANLVLYLWNLKTRAQAFIWKTEFQTVSKAFDKWCNVVQLSRITEATAQQSAKQYLTSKLVSSFRKQKSDWDIMRQVQSRARFYIGVMKGLNAVDRTVETHREEERKMRRAQREREGREQKIYLEAMHVEASSRRKKRDFLRAFNKWSEAAAMASRLKETALVVQEDRSIKRCKSVWELWSRYSNTYQQQEVVTQTQRSLPWFEAWQAATRQHEDQDMQAWGLWAVRKQRRYLREWLFNSLHQSGQAHTAARVSERHEIEKRHRCLQQWQLAAVVVPEMATGQPTMSVFEAGLSTSGNAFRPTSTPFLTGRRGLEPEEEALTPLQTPSKSSGTQRPLSSTIIGQRTPSTQKPEGFVSHSFSGLYPTPSELRRTGHFRRFKAPTTTPQVPVPEYLQQSTAPSYGRFTRTPQDPTSTDPSVLFPLWKDRGLHQSRIEGIDGDYNQELFLPIQKSRSVSGFPDPNIPIRKKGKFPTPASASRVSRTRSAWTISAAQRVPSKLAPSRSLRASKMLQAEDEEA